MLSIQEAGKQILTGNPGKFYIFAGSEYGIKEKYLSALKEHYGEFVEVESMADIFDLMSSRHIIPLVPKLYIIRYDEEFIQSLTAKTQERILDLNIIGTVVCIYELSKHVSKCCTHIPDCTISFEPVNPTFLKKYLNADFPDLDSALLDTAIKLRTSYRGASTICNCFKYMSKDSLQTINNEVILSTFGGNCTTTDSQFKIAVASRNFSYALSILDSYNNNVDGLFYVILNTLIELERLVNNPRTQSELKPYVNRWPLFDIYNMFSLTYTELHKSRSISSYIAYNGIVYLLGLLQFSPVINMEV